MPSRLDVPDTRSDAALSARGASTTKRPARVWPSPSGRERWGLLGSRALGVLLLLAVSCTSWVETSPEPIVYEVKGGDTLFVIARDHDVTLEALMAVNDLKHDRIDVGQRLIIPGEVAAIAAIPSPPSRRTQQERSTPAPGGPDPTGLSQPALSLPSAKACLAGPDVNDLQDEAGVLLSQGLNRSQVSAAMSAFMPKVQPCLRGLESSPSTSLMFNMNVGCDGRVASARNGSLGDWPAPVAACLAEAFRFIPFPAHDLPDGFTFQYPLRMQ